MNGPCHTHCVLEFLHWATCCSVLTLNTIVSITPSTFALFKKITPGRLSTPRLKCTTDSDMIYRTSPRFQIPEMNATGQIEILVLLRHLWKSKNYYCFLDKLLHLDKWADFESILTRRWGSESKNIVALLFKLNMKSLPFYAAFTPQIMRPSKVCFVSLLLMK